MENDLEKLKLLAAEKHDDIKKLMTQKKALKKLIHQEMDVFFRLEAKIIKLERAEHTCMLTECNGLTMLTCQHVYSKAFDQPFPRLCIKCNEPEKQ